MAVIKEMIFHISSSIENLDESGLTVGDAEKEDFAVNGFYKIKDGSITLSYIEKRENSKVFCDITAEGKAVRVKRFGSVECEMLFDVGKTHKSLYKIPPFSFDMEIKALRIENALLREGGSLSLLYTMTVGGAPKHCRMKITAEKA